MSAPKGVADILLKTEKTDPLTGEPYKDADGNIIQMEDIVKGPPCLAVIVEQWQNPHPETLIGAANESKDPAITVGSFLVCKFCGVIEPISSGQPVLEPPTVDPEEAMPPEPQEEAEDMGHADEESGMMQTSQIVNLGSGLGFVGAGSVVGGTVAGIANAAPAQTGDPTYSRTLDDYYNQYYQPFQDSESDATAYDLHKRGVIMLPQATVFRFEEMFETNKNKVYVGKAVRRNGMERHNG